MNISLTLTPEKQAELERRAAAEGVDLERFILEAVREKLDDRNGSAGEPVPFDEWQGEFRAWVASHHSRNPRFDDCRESIYD
jgi:hypothetical protein